MDIPRCVICNTVLPDNRSEICLHCENLELYDKSWLDSLTEKLQRSFSTAIIATQQCVVYAIAVISGLIGVIALLWAGQEFFR